MSPMYDYGPVPEYIEDMLGHKVRPGDRIAYATTVGRSGELVIGKVVEFKWPKDRYSRDPELKIAVLEEARATGRRWGDLSKPTLIHANMKRFFHIEAAAEATRPEEDPRPKTDWELELDALHAATPKVEAAPALNEQGSFVGYLVSVEDRIVGQWNADSGFKVLQ